MSLCQGFQPLLFSAQKVGFLAVRTDLQTACSVLVWACAGISASIPALRVLRSMPRWMAQLNGKKAHYSGGLFKAVRDHFSSKKSLEGRNCHLITCEPPGEFLLAVSWQQINSLNWTEYMHTYTHTQTPAPPPHRLMPHKTMSTFLPLIPAPLPITAWGPSLQQHRALREVHRIHSLILACFLAGVGRVRGKDTHTLS